MKNPFWISAFQSEFVPEINAIVDVLEKRLLPNIEEEEIEAESGRITEEEWERFMSMPGTGEEDPADFADKAENAGISHYQLMNGIRQGMLNLFAAALYHAFEQQVMFFHRKNVLHLDEENDPKLFKMSVFQSRLEKFGINIKNFSSWPKIDELRWVANAVKHAEGDSSHKLREIRPDMFQHPLLSQVFDPPALPMFQPLIGDGLYVSLQDIKNYRDHLARFYQELTNALQCD